MLLPENLCNRLPGSYALVIREDTPSPLPIGCPTDGRTQLTSQNRVVVTPCNGLVLLLSSAGGPALPGSLLRLGIPYQACMDTHFPEVHPPGDPRPDILGPANDQRLLKDNVDKDEGPL